MISKDNSVTAIFDKTVANPQNTPETNAKKIPMTYSFIKDLFSKESLFMSTPIPSPRKAIKEPATSNKVIFSIESICEINDAQKTYV